MPSVFGKKLPWEDNVVTCYLESCDQAVDKHGEFCCKEHRDKYWEPTLKAKKKYTIKEIQKRMKDWCRDKEYNEALKIFY